MLTLLHRIVFRVKSLLGRSRIEDEFESEIQTHLGLLIEENLRSGMSATEARRLALLRFGGVIQTEERHRQSRGIALFEALIQDIRYAFRQMRSSPGFTTIAVLSLALGIGANTALFQLFEAVAVETLPVANPQELQIVGMWDRGKTGNMTGRWPVLTYEQWVQMQSGQQAFSDMAAWSDSLFNTSEGGESRYARTLFVSGNFFHLLGVQPVLGRLLTSDDDKPGCAGSHAVISYSFWQREFGGDASAVGKNISLDGHSFDIVGVTPASFFGAEVGRNFDAAIPICAEGVINVGSQNRLARRHAWWLAAIGRLKPGVTAQQAGAELANISPGIFEETLPPNYSPERAKRYLAFKLTTRPGASGMSQLRSDYLKPLTVLMAISGLVLLIACANLANLLLARASAREREIATRLSLGASRGRLIRQLISESMLLALIGTAMGALISQALSRFLLSSISTRDNQVFVNLSLDGTVLGFIVGLSVVTCLLFGLAPAIKATRNVSNTIRSTGRGTTPTREKLGLRRGLVVSQVSLSLVLFIGALLFIRTMRNLSTQHLGFEPDGISVAQISFVGARVSRENNQQFKDGLLDRIRTIPGVDSAADARMVPIVGDWWNEFAIVDGHKAISNADLVSPGYFKTMRIAMIAGRDFDNRDNDKSTTVAVVNEAFSREFFEGASPLGKIFHFEVGPGEPDKAYEIIGLVKDTKYTGIRTGFEPLFYLPDSQRPISDAASTVLIRSSLPSSALLPSVKNVLAEVSPAITLDFQTLDSQIDDSMLLERLMAKLSAFFGVLAAMLASLGLYGVMSYMVTQRKNEIGIRTALGATRASIVRMILSEAGVLVVVGLVIGTVGTVFAARAATTMLFGLEPTDLTTYVMGASGLALVGILAGLIPAQRAARLDPMTALRSE